jgi:hypothetical protein
MLNEIHRYNSLLFSDKPNSTAVNSELSDLGGRTRLEKTAYA